MNTINQIRANDFHNAETAADFDALCDAFRESIAFSYDSNEAFEAAGGDGMCEDALDKFLNDIGAVRPAE
ncbi:MAG: hypothetical protein ACXIUV_07020 [Alkalilacustris sp.]